MAVTRVLVSWTLHLERDGRVDVVTNQRVASQQPLPDNLTSEIQGLTRSFNDQLTRTMQRYLPELALEADLEGPLVDQTSDKAVELELLADRLLRRYKSAGWWLLPREERQAERRQLLKMLTQGVTPQHHQETVCH